MNPDDPLGLIGASKQQPAADDPLGLKSSAPRIPTKLEIAKRNASEPHPEDMEDAEPSYAQKALGGIAALGHDIPGVEALQAGARTLRTAGGSANLATPEGRAQAMQGYRESLSDIKKAENAAPAFARNWNNVAGGTIAALAGPKGTFMEPLGVGGSAAVQGARYGAAQGLLSADPDQTVKDRILQAGKKGAVAATISGLIGDAPPKIAQLTKILGSRTPGAAAIGRRAEINVADEAYPQLLSQAKGATHPDVTAMLDNPYVKPYADAARESPSLQGADDATILHEVYKTLGTRQRALADRTERAANYLAGPEREIQDIDLIKKQMRDAAEKIMPGYGETVATHAKLSGSLEALKDTKDATARIMNNGNVAGRNLESNSPEAFKISILKMQKDQAEAAREAMLGQLHERAGEYLNAKPWKGFGIPAANSAINRVSPYLQMIQDQISRRAPVPLDELPVSQSAGVLRKALATSVGADRAH